MRKLSPEAIRPLLPQIDSDVLDIDVLGKSGLFILRQALARDVVTNWQADWKEFYKTLSKGRQINPRNNAIVYEPSPPALAGIYKYPGLLDIVEKVHGPDIAFYFQRFLLKDSNNPSPVFLHQDYAYNTGFPEKINIFIALNPISAENGGLKFYPGSHNYGYLGDIGELDADALAPDMPVICPALEPGDVVLMHQYTWHGSGAYHGGPERAMMQICYQPADDPTGVELLRGQWQVDRVTGPYENEKIFTRSRIQRLREMQAQIDAMEKKS